MSRAGFCYVLVSSGLPGHCKIGRTVREVRLRATELWKEYGTLEPFVEASRHLVSDCVAVETMVHRKLKKLRVPGSELFRCSVRVAQDMIRWAAKEVLGRPWYVRLLCWMITPRAEARPRTLAKARGFYRRHNPWPLLLAASAVLIFAGLICFQPTMPDWIPEAVAHPAVWIETMRR